MTGSPISTDGCAADHQRLPVLLVQSVLASTIVLTALIARFRRRASLRRVDRGAIAACTVGLVVIASGMGTDRPTAEPWWAVLVLAVGACLITTGTVASWNSGRAWPLAVLAGLGFGGTACSPSSSSVTRSGPGDGARSGWDSCSPPSASQCWRAPPL